MSRKIILSLFSFIILVLSCNTTEPPSAEKTITLTLEDAASIEAWIKLTTTNLQRPASLTLMQNEQTRNIINLVSADTLLYINSLLPKTTYTFQASSHSSLSAIKSNKLSVNTLDTTSHDFNLQSFTLGEFGSVVHDVVALGNTNYIAVGVFYLIDETQPYGLAIYSQGEWTFHKLKAELPSSGTTNIFPDGVLAFSLSEMWFANGSVFYWDGINVQPFWISKFPGNPNPLFSDGQFARKIWGNSNSNIYVGGDLGALAHFDGTNWMKIESNTASSITDIWGPEINSSSNGTIYCAALDFNLQNNGIIKVFEENSKVEQLNWDLSNFIITLWLKNELPIYAGGLETFVNRNGMWDMLEFSGSSVPLKIRGQKLNDIFIVGSSGLIMHYNGVNWYKITEQVFESDIFSSISLYNNNIIIGGDFQSRGKIIIGNR